MQIEILPSALDDLRAGYRFYEKQQQGLGDYFEDSLYSDIDSLILYAGIHSVVFGYHRLHSKRFPFAVYYQVRDGNCAVVHRVLDMRQNSEGIRESLE